MLMTLKEAKTYTGLSDSTLRQYIRDGMLKSFKRGKKIIVVESNDLDALMKQDV
jgi:excisionase family DNA binding protein